jgi:hypothetical protein
MSSGEVDPQEITDYIKEYLKYWDLNTSLESLEEQIALKGLPNKNINRNPV